jgi:hypothetical protein
VYKQVETDKEINGGSHTPVATLADEYGGRVNIVVDDHCYVLMLKQSSSEITPSPYYKSSAWIFKEAFEVLKKLPNPT